MKFDEDVPIEAVRMVAKAFKEANVEVPMDLWIGNQSRDFYLGMFAAMRVCLVGLKNLGVNNEATVETFTFEIHAFQGEVANRILAKEIILTNE